jgi:hypothetical protein
LFKPVTLAPREADESTNIKHVINTAEFRNLAGPALLLAMAITATVAVAADIPESPGFVGSDRCVQCHQEIYATWRQSDHSKAMQPAIPDTVLGNFDNVKVSFHGIETRLYRQGKSYRVSTTTLDARPGDFPVKYTFGHYPVQQYLVDIGNGHLQALNIAWDSRSADEGGQRWYHLQPDADIDPEHPFFWTGHFQNANSRCIECHTTDVRKNYDAETKAYASTWSEPTVGCESCHGPASRHLAMATANELSNTETGFRQKARPRLTWVFRGNADVASPAGTKDDSYIDTCGG